MSTTNTQNFDRENDTDKSSTDHPSEVRHGDHVEETNPGQSFEGNYDQVVESFDDMNLKADLIRGIYSYGLKKPSAIQQRAIVPCIQRKDVIVKAQAGAGKTVMYAIAILQQIDTNIKECQALVLSPTREVAIHAVQKTILALGDYLGVTCHACVGSTNIRKDIKQLESGSQVVAGTPGRVQDMIQRGILRKMASDIKIFVLDETDEIFSRGFKEEVYNILKPLPEDIQIIVLTTSLPPEVVEVSKNFMREPIRICVNYANLSGWKDPAFDDLLKYRTQ